MDLLASWEHMVKSGPFAYHRAHSVDEAVALLAGLGDKAKILAAPGAPATRVP
ncbi:MAG TPA: hypothetical protein VK284_01670 [Streptosporangiaceae bacterium]|nr:hypothetical protein [Streptosporangiaceae bacterium]HLN70230.1 hypothetical protein [Streptosporangiaceae bacterium]